MFWRWDALTAQAPGPSALAGSRSPHPHPTRRRAPGSPPSAAGLFAFLSLHRFVVFCFFFSCLSSFSGQAICLVGLFQPERPEACMSQAFPTSACITQCKRAPGSVPLFARGQRGGSGGGGAAGGSASFLLRFLTPRRCNRGRFPGQMLPPGWLAFPFPEPFLRLAPG